MTRNPFLDALYSTEHFLSSGAPICILTDRSRLTVGVGVTGSGGVNAGGVEWVFGGLILSRASLSFAAPMIATHAKSTMEMSRLFLHHATMRSKRVDGPSLIRGSYYQSEKECSSLCQCLEPVMHFETET